MAAKPKLKARKTVRKTVAYRKAHFHNIAHSPTLEQLLTKAKALVPIIHSRREATNSPATEFRFISDWGAMPSGGLYGRLSIVQKSKYPIALRDDLKAKTIPLKEFPPPKGHDYSPGLCHFIVVDNHVVMTQSTLLRSSSLEMHLAWLLRNQTKQLQQDQGISLSDEPQKATKERIRKAHVKSVMIGRPILDEALAATERGKTRDVFKANTSGPIVQLLREVIGMDGFDRLGLKDGVFESNLEVWIEIRYPKYSRSQTEKSMKLLDDLSLALRDVDEEDIKLSLSDGSVVRGRDLKVSGHVEVASTADDHGIQESDLYVQMAAALKDWIKQGTVAPN